MILIRNYTRVDALPEAASSGASFEVSLTIAPWPGNRDDRFPGGARPRRDRPCAAPVLRPGAVRRAAPRATGFQEPRRRARHHGRGPAAADRRHLVHAARRPRGHPSDGVGLPGFLPASAIGPRLPGAQQHGLALRRSAAGVGAGRHAQGSLRQPASQNRSREAPSWERPRRLEPLPQPDEPAYARPHHAGTRRDRQGSDIRRLRLRLHLQLGERDSGGARGLTSTGRS